MTQLFNLRNDPDERHNLADAPRHRPRRDRLLRLLSEEQRRYGDSAPLAVSNPKPREFVPPVQE